MSATALRKRSTGIEEPGGDAPPRPAGHQRHPHHRPDRRGQDGPGNDIPATAVANDIGALFVSFEKSRAGVTRSALSFVWGQALVDSTHWDVIDARPPPPAMASGGFELDGLLIRIEQRGHRAANAEHRQRRSAILAQRGRRDRGRGQRQRTPPV